MEATVQWCREGAWAGNENWRRRRCVQPRAGEQTRIGSGTEAAAEVIRLGSDEPSWFIQFGSGVFVDRAGGDVGPDGVSFFREVVFRLDLEQSSGGDESLTAIAEALEDCLLLERGGNVETEQHVAGGIAGDFLSGAAVDIGHSEGRTVAEDGEVEGVVASKGVGEGSVATGLGGVFTGRLVYDDGEAFGLRPGDCLRRGGDYQKRKQQAIHGGKGICRTLEFQASFGYTGGMRDHRHFQSFLVFCCSRLRAAST